MKTSHTSLLEFVWRFMRPADLSSSVNKVALYDAYRRRCEKTGVVPVNSSKFNKMIRISMNPYESTNEKAWSGSWRGIAYKNGREEMPRPLRSTRVKSVGSPVATKADRTAYRIKSSSYTFVSECVRTGDSGMTISRVSLRSMYEIWCRNKNVKIESARYFNKMILLETSASETRIGKQHIIGWRGIMCKMAKEEEKSKVTVAKDATSKEPDIILPDADEAKRIAEEVMKEFRESDEKVAEMRLNEAADKSRVR